MIHGLGEGETISRGLGIKNRRATYARKMLKCTPPPFLENPLVLSSFQDFGVFRSQLTSYLLIFFPWERLSTRWGLKNP